MKYSTYRGAGLLGITVVLFSALGLAFDSNSEKDFLRENDTAMTRMMNAMALKPTGNIDRDFVAMMSPHHQGAIEMAEALLRHGHNERLKRLAQEIIITQQQEIVAMQLAIRQEAAP